jgi:hypothetical protein
VGTHVSTTGHCRRLHAATGRSPVHDRRGDASERRFRRVADSVRRGVCAWLRGSRIQDEYRYLGASAGRCAAISTLHASVLRDRSPGGERSNRCRTGRDDRHRRRSRTRVPGKRCTWSPRRTTRRRHFRSRSTGSLRAAHRGRAGPCRCLRKRCKPVARACERAVARSGGSFRSRRVAVTTSSSCSRGNTPARIDRGCCGNFLRLYRRAIPQFDCARGRSPSGVRLGQRPRAAHDARNISSHRLCLRPCCQHCTLAV